MSYFSHSCPPYRGDYKTRRDFKRAKDEWRKKCKDIPEYIRCDDCGGSGEIPDYDLTSVVFSEFVSWSEGWRNNFDTYVSDEIIDDDDYHNFIENNQTLLLHYVTLKSEHYKDFEVGELLFDELIFQPTVSRAGTIGHKLVVKNFRH